MTLQGRKHKEDRVEVLTKPQIRKVWDIPNGRNRVLILLGLETASRVNEMPYFQVAGIDWENHTIKKFDIKKKEWRVIGISERLVNDLRSYIHTLRIHGDLFDIQWQMMNKILRQACEDIGIKGWVSWHLLRRTYCSQAADAGISMEEVIYVTGDKPSTIARYYKRVSPGDIGAKVGRLYNGEE